MTHAIRTRILTFCLAVLPAGIVFSLLLLCPLSGLFPNPQFFRALVLLLLPAIRWLCMEI